MVLCQRRYVAFPGFFSGGVGKVDYLGGGENDSGPVLWEIIVHFNGLGGGVL